MIKKLSNYKGLKAEKNKVIVKKEEIDKSLEYLQNSRAKIITINQPAKKGNRLEIDFEIRQGGVKIENGTSKNHPLILGQGRFLPGFEKELEGMKADEEKEFSLEPPGRGKNFDIKVKINLVQKRELPDINNEFAKSLGNFDSLDGLKQSIKDGLMQEKEIKEKQRIRIELIEKIAQDSEIDAPDDLVKQELEKMIAEFKIGIANMGLDFNRYLKEINKSFDELKKDWQKQAEKRVKIGLCIQEIAQRENIDVSDEEVKERINQDLKHYPDVEQVKKNIDLDALKEYTENILKNEKVFELLEREAKIT